MKVNPPAAAAGSDTFCKIIHIITTFAVFQLNKLKLLVYIRFNFGKRKTNYGG